MGRYLNRRGWSWPRGGWWLIAGGVGALIAASLVYDALIARVSTTRSTFAARHAKCGPITNSGPKEQTGFRSPKLYFLMARLEDGRLVRVERHSAPLPACGATLEIAERVTPWGQVWYALAK